MWHFDMPIYSVGIGDSCNLSLLLNISEFTKGLLVRFRHIDEIEDLFEKLGGIIK